MDQDLYTFTLRRLEQSQGSWPRIAADLGFSYSWLTKFASGQIPNASYHRVAALAAYFKAADASVSS